MDIKKSKNDITETLTMLRSAVKGERKVSEKIDDLHEMLIDLQMYITVSGIPDEESIYLEERINEIRNKVFEIETNLLKGNCEERCNYCGDIMEISVYRGCDGVDSLFLLDIGIPGTTKECFVEFDDYTSNALAMSKIDVRAGDLIETHGELHTVSDVYEDGCVEIMERFVVRPEDYRVVERGGRE